MGLSASSQVRTNTGAGELGSRNISWDDQFIIVDKNGRNFHSYYEGIDGHPYFIEDFKYSTIILSSGETFNNVLTRLDLYKQQVEFRLKSDTVKVALPGTVLEITFYDTSQSVPQSYKFQSGYPDVDNLKKSNFYEVLADGNVTMLKSRIKKINQTKDEISGQINKQFDTYEDHYLYVNYEMKRLKKDKAYLLNLLADKSKELEAYISSEKLNFKSFDSIKKLVTYYNTL